MVEYEDWVLCSIIQHMWRAVLRALTTMSSPSRGANYGRPDMLVGLYYSTAFGWPVSSLVYIKSPHRVRQYATHQKMSHTSLSVMRG